MASAEHYEVRVLGDKANWAEKDVLTWLATMGGVHTMLSNQSAELRCDMRRIELAAEAAGSAVAPCGASREPPPAGRRGRPSASRPPASSGWT